MDCKPFEFSVLNTAVNDSMGFNTLLMCFEKLMKTPNAPYIDPLETEKPSLASCWLRRQKDFVSRTKIVIETQDCGHKPGESVQS